MYKKLTASLMAAIMTILTVAAPALAATSLANYPTFLAKDNALDAYVVVGSAAATSDVVGAVDLAVRLAELSKTTTTVAGAALTVDGVDKDGISIGTASGGAALSSAITGGAALPNNGVLKTAHYSTLKDSTYKWKTSSYDYREQVDVTGVRMRHDLATDKINGTETMVIGTNGDIKYQFVFEKEIWLNASGLTSTTGTIASPEYTYPIKVKMMGKEFVIVGVSSTQLKMLSGSSGTADATTPVKYGDYSVYATQGSSNTLKTVIKDKDGNTVDTIIFTGLTSGTAATKESSATGLEITVTAFGTLTDGTVTGADLVVGPTGTTTHTFDTTADVESTAVEANDAFPGAARWGIQYNTVGTTGAGDRRIPVNAKIDVLYKPKEIQYLKAGSEVLLPNDYGKLKFVGFNTDNFATVTIKPGGAWSAYNSTDNQVASDLYGIEISSDKSGVIQTAPGNQFSKAYVLFNMSRGTTVFPVAIGLYDAAKGYIVVNDSWSISGATGIYSSNYTGSAEYGWGVLPNSTDFYSIFKLNNGETDFYLNFTIGNLTVTGSPLAKFSVTAGSSMFGTIFMDFQNRTPWTASAAPQFRLGLTSASGDDTEVNVTTEATVNTGGKKSQDVVDDSGIQVLSTSGSTGENAVKLKVPSKTLGVRVIFGKETTTTTGVTSEKIVAITTAVAKLDSEVTATEKTKNLVLVGGPCKNTLTATLAAKSDTDALKTCATWPGENFALIMAFDDAFTTGKVALVVAGTRAEDTRLGTSVLQQYDTAAVKNKLTGTAVKITGTAVSTATIAAA